MSIVVLHHSRFLSLASTQRVFSAEECGSLMSVVEQAERLNDTLSREEQRVRDACDAAREQGYEAGYLEGIRAGHTSAEQELALERRQLNAMRASAEQHAMQMAFDIVRKLADTLDMDELLCALAVTASRCYGPDESLVLRVHEDRLAGVTHRLNALTTEAKNRFRHVSGEPGIDPRSCIVESRDSRIIADLDTQVEQLEAKLSHV